MVSCSDCLTKPQGLILKPGQGYRVLRSRNEVDVGSVENVAYPILQGSFGHQHQISSIFRKPHNVDQHGFLLYPLTSPRHKSRSE